MLLKIVKIHHVELGLESKPDHNPTTTRTPTNILNARFFCTLFYYSLFFFFSLKTSTESKPFIFIFIFIFIIISFPFSSLSPVHPSLYLCFRKKYVHGEFPVRVPILIVWSLFFQLLLFYSLFSSICSRVRQKKMSATTTIVTSQQGVFTQFINSMGDQSMRQRRKKLVSNTTWDEVSPVDFESLATETHPVSFHITATTDSSSSSSSSKNELMETINSSANMAESMSMVYLMGCMVMLCLSLVFLGLTLAYSPTSINMTSFISLTMRLTLFETYVFPVSIPIGVFSGGTVMVCMAGISMLMMLINGLSCHSYYRTFKDLTRSYITSSNDNGDQKVITGRTSDSGLFFNVLSYQLAELNIHYQTNVPIGIAFSLCAVLTMATLGLVHVEALVPAVFVVFVGSVIVAVMQTITQIVVNTKSISDFVIPLFGILGAILFLIPWIIACVLVNSLIRTSGWAAVPSFFWGMLIVGFIFAFLHIAASVITFFVVINPMIFETVNVVLIVFLNITIALTFYLGGIMSNNIDQIQGINALISSS